MSLAQFAGILPAIVFPAATAGQLWRMVRTRSVAGVNASTWLLFGFANLAIYFYAERYAEWQAILGMLVTALLDFAIVALALRGFRPAAPTRRLALSSPPSVATLPESWHPAL